MPPTVSINLCCYNSEKYLEETLQSIFAQTYKNWELIIINDGSTDSTERIIQQYIKDGWPIIYHYQINAGLGQSRNKALELSQGEFIAFIDHDDLWMPEKLEIQVPLFDKDEETGIVFCNTIFFNDKGFQKEVYRKWKPPRGMVFSALLSNYFLALPSVVVRKKALEANGEWFDPQFKVIEEYDLFLRLSYSWKVDYVYEPLAKWRMHNTSQTYSTPITFPQEQERMLKKFEGLFENFNQKYIKEIDILRSKIAIRYALIEFERGNRMAARSLMRPYWKINRRIGLYYFFTFFPYSFFLFLYRLFSGVRPI